MARHVTIKWKKIQTIQNQITWHDSSDHKLDEVYFDSFVLLADELEEALSVGRIDAVFVETRRCHDAAGIVHAAPDCDLATAEQLKERELKSKEIDVIDS